MALTLEELTQLLTETKILTKEQLENAIQTSEVSKISLEEDLVASGVITDRDLGLLIATKYDVPFVELENLEIEPTVAHLLPETFARLHDLLPIRRTPEKVTIATTSPDDVVERALLEKYLRTEVSFVYSTKRDVRSHMFLYQTDPQEAFKAVVDRVENGRKNTMDTRTIDLVSMIINYAYQTGASDVHIEPEDDYTIVRFRQDGMLHDIARLPVKLHENIMTRLKVISRLATDEHRSAQDGKINHKTGWGEEVEIRLSIIPTTHAEKAVMRLLSDQSHNYSLSEIGLAPDDYTRVQDVISKPYGAILVTGPTGSGKTTTLYAMLHILNKREVNVTTIEDPVEFDIEGVNQIQVNEKTGLTFAKGLRSVVRQDPDIIMVGEIRDKETASIAVNAAMTGHLVLSTLHTNDSATAFVRLNEMGVEDFLMASTVNVVIAQRLVRKTCMSCIQSKKLTKIEKELIERVPNVKTYLKEISKKKTFSTVNIFEGKGCHVCHGSGFKGRIGVFETLVVTDKIREAIMEQKNSDEIRALAIKEGMTTMLYDGIRKMMSGKTTLEEVLRVTRE